MGQQLEPWAARAPRADESRGGAAEHELELLALVVSHEQPPALVTNGHDHAMLAPAAEVHDLRVRAHTRKRSQGGHAG
jgi:hypothetical protein